MQGDKRQGGLELEIIQGDSLPGGLELILTTQKITDVNEI
jgi:hypothetical protein